MTTPSIEVIETTVTVEVVEENAVEVVKVIHPGPQGPPGSGGNAAYVHTQATPANTWTINHNLGYRPAVELLDSSNQEIDAEVSHPNVNQTIIMFSIPLSGLARLT